MQIRRLSKPTIEEPQQIYDNNNIDYQNKTRQSPDSPDQSLHTTRKADVELGRLQFEDAFEKASQEAAA